VLLLIVVVLVVLTGTFWVVVVVVSDCSENCGTTELAGTPLAHPAAPRVPIKKVRATYSVIDVFFFIVSI